MKQKCALEENFFFVTAFRYVMMTLGRQRDKRNAAELVDAVITNWFGMKSCKKFIKSPKDCKNVAFSDVEKGMVDDESQNDSHGKEMFNRRTTTAFHMWKFLGDVYCKKDEFRRKEDLFCTGQKRKRVAVSTIVYPSVTIDYSYSWYKEIE